MRTKLTIIISLMLLLSCCEGSKKELETRISDLQSQLEQQQLQLERYRDLRTELAELKKATETVSMSSLQVLDRLDELDKDLYDGIHVGSLRARQAKTNEIVEGYISLIDNIQRDLEGKSKESIE